MLDFARIVGFDWDSGNATKSAEKHDVSSGAAEQVFFNQPLIVSGDLAHSDRESRYHALGQTDEGRLLLIVFTLRGGGTRIRIISARDMSNKERRRYEQQV